MSVWDELAELGSATVYEAGGRRGLVDASFVRAVPGSRVAGAARTVRCGQDDNLMVHAVMERVEPGDVLVLDADGVAVVSRGRIEEVLVASRARAEKETVKRAALEAGGLSYDLDGLRALVEL
jgi:4-hydroxy-4-methyl-2-oxoglutarate aldolase